MDVTDCGGKRYELNVKVNATNPLTNIGVCTFKVHIDFFFLRGWGLPASLVSPTDRQCALATTTGVTVVVSQTGLLIITVVLYFSRFVENKSQTRSMGSMAVFSLETGILPQPSR